MKTLIAAPIAAIACLIAIPAAAQDYQSSPERRTVQEKDWGQWLGPFRAKLVPSLMKDFGERYLYADADAKLAPPKPNEQRVVFLGDSITDKWDLTKSFPGKPYVNRGIGSQVTAQMVLRFHADVVALKPKAVVILAGINDIQGFLQEETVEGIESNYAVMADIADANHIAVVFGSILPVNNYSDAAKDVLKERDPAKIHALNAWLQAFCKRRGYTFANYWPALVDAKGLMTAGYTKDGVHPLANGYARMAPIAEQAIETALRTQRKRR